MKIGIISAGQIGGTLTRRFTALGYDVAVANSRGPEPLAELAAETDAKAVSVKDAAKFGEVVVVTIPEKNIPELPRDLFAETPKRVVVIDTGNSEVDHRVYLPSSPLSSEQRAWSNICAPCRVQRMCCFFSIRQSTSWSTVDSTRAVDMRRPSRYSLP